MSDWHTIDIEKSDALADAYVRVGGEQPVYAAEALRMRICTDRCKLQYFHFISANSIDDHKYTGSCQADICMSCFLERWLSNRNDVTQQILKHSFQMSDPKLITPTFVSPWRSAIDGRQMLASHKAAWAAMTRLKSFDDVVDAYARFLAIDINITSFQIRCRTSAVILARHVRGLSASDDWLSYWNSRPQCDADTLESFAMHDLPNSLNETAVDRLISPSVRPCLEPYSLCELQADGWRCDPNKLLVILKTWRSAHSMTFGFGWRAARSLRA